MTYARSIGGAGLLLIALSVVGCVGPFGPSRPQMATLLHVRGGDGSVTLDLDATKTAESTSGDVWRVQVTLRNTGPRSLSVVRIAGSATPFRVTVVDRSGKVLSDSTPSTTVSLPWPDPATTTTTLPPGSEIRQVVDVIAPTNAYLLNTATSYRSEAPTSGAPPPDGIEVSAALPQN